MKQTLIALSLALSVSGFAQSKKKEIVIRIDSAEAVKFLTILQVGAQSLMQTQIPANQVGEMQRYGDSLFRANVAIFNSWIPKQDTTAKPKK